MNTLRFLSSALLILSVVGLTLSPAHGQDVRETRTVDAFSALHLKVPGDVQLSQGDAQSVEIRAASQEVIDALEIDVRGNRLVIDGDLSNNGGLLSRLFGDDGMDDDDLMFVITVTSLTGIQVDGTGDVEGQTPFSTEDLTLEINGTGDIDLDVEATTIETRISGTGDVELEGTADRHEISISGTGDVEAETLETRETVARVSGTGDCVVHATERLDATVSGLGDVKYIGSPKVDATASGLGSVEPYQK
jgi:hypothetical protein